MRKHTMILAASVLAAALALSGCATVGKTTTGLLYSETRLVTPTARALGVSEDDVKITDLESTGSGSYFNATVISTGEKHRCYNRGSIWAGGTPQPTGCGEDGIKRVQFPF